MRTFRKINSDRCPWKILRLFVASVKNVSINTVIFDADQLKLSNEESSQLESMIARYENNEPISKILNKKEFWTSEFYVNQDVLDPRPETEIIVESSLGLFSRDQNFRFLDIGTGSGCILLSIAKEFPNSTGVGIDINEKSIEVAIKNKKDLHINNVTIKHVGWNDFQPTQQFDLIVSNPPYIRTQEILTLDDNVKNFDPKIALDGGESGLDAYNQLALLIRGWIKPRGKVLLEIGYDQYLSVKTIFESQSFVFDCVHLDMQNIRRVLEFSYKLD